MPVKMAEEKNARKDTLNRVSNCLPILGALWLQVIPTCNILCQVLFSKLQNNLNRKQMPHTVKFGLHSQAPHHEHSYVINICYCGTEKPISKVPQLQTACLCKAP